MISLLQSLVHALALFDSKQCSECHSLLSSLPRLKQPLSSIKLNLIKLQLDISLRLNLSHLDTNAYHLALTSALEYSDDKKRNGLIDDILFLQCQSCIASNADTSLLLTRMRDSSHKQELLVAIAYNTSLSITPSPLNEPDSAVYYSRAGIYFESLGLNAIAIACFDLAATKRVGLTHNQGVIRLRLGIPDAPLLFDDQARIEAEMEEVDDAWRRSFK